MAPNGGSWVDLERSELSTSSMPWLWDAGEHPCPDCAQLLRVMLSCFLHAFSPLS